MEESKKENLTNKQVNLVKRYRSRVKEIDEETICKKIVNRETNSLDFYKITPKDQLPIFLQKMKFQTLHLKEKDITNTIKIFKKENRNPTEQKLRRKIKQSGHIMLLSEIYQNLGEPGIQLRKQPHHAQEQPNELDDWEKKHKLNKGDAYEPRFARDGKQMGSTRGFREGCDYRGQIERGLEIIDVTHGSQANLLNRYTLIENSSKLLKKELEEKKIQIEQNIKNRMKLLYEARTQYHTYFEEKNRLYIEDKVLKEEPKDDIMRMSHKSLCGRDKSKKSLTDINESRIARTKKTIEGLEEAIVHLEEELKKILQAEKLYFQLTLRNGSDVRQTGLVWVIEKLEIKQSDMPHYQFPAYLDRRGKHFLLQKAQNEEEKETLLSEKKKFVNEIGRTTSDKKFKVRTLVHSKQSGNSNDKIVENDFRVDGDIPKKYRKSQRKMSALVEQFYQTSSFLDVRNAYRQVEISGDLDGLTNKEIYSQVGERIKRLDLSKIKRQKLGTKGVRLLQYQSLLEKIKEAHIRLQDMDLQHQNYLLSQYRDSRNHFFMQAAACFGYKRAYSMIIKHYSWKNYNDETLDKRSQ